jgi:hypothetical protein
MTALPQLPGTIPPALAPAIVDDDVPCSKCGYNLRTQAVDANCPECGYGVAQTLEDRRRIWLCNRDPRWVRRLAWGAGLLAVMSAMPVFGIILQLVPALIYYVTGGGQLLRFVWAFYVISIASVTIGLAGTWLITVGERNAPGVSQWRWGAWIARGAAVVALGMAVLSYAMRALIPGASGGVTQPFGLMLNGVWSASHALLAVMLGLHCRNLARRLPSRALAWQLPLLFCARVAMAIIVFFGFFAIMAWIHAGHHQMLTWYGLTLNGLHLVVDTWLTIGLIVFTARLVRSAKMARLLA